MRNVPTVLVALLAVLVPAGLAVLPTSTAGATTGSGNFTVLLTTRTVDDAGKDPTSKSPTPPIPMATLSLKEARTVLSCASPTVSVVKYTTYELVNYSCDTPTKIFASYDLSIIGQPAREHATAGPFDGECFTTYTSTTLNEPPYTYTYQQWTCSGPQKPLPTPPPNK
ncbi:MAG: hypothetical protein ACLPVY_15495 [Acidimicrobiia bacterium]